MSLLRGLRSAASLLAVLVFWGVVGFPWLYLIVVPAAVLRPDKHRALVSWFMKGICHAIFAGFRLGGARFRRTGVLPTRETILVVMNHQSLLDIPVATLMADPFVPAFIPRLRYARFVPLVSRCIRMLDCPIVDPKRDARGAIERLRAAARSEPHGLLIIPEGHRTRDGELRPFRAAGLQAILETRRLPVYLVVSDGYWLTRRLLDFVFRVHAIRGETEVLGPFAAPEQPEAIPAAIEGWRNLMVERLHEMRRRRGVA